MKRKAVFLTIILMVSFFSACGRAEDPENLFEMPTSQEQENITGQEIDAEKESVEPEAADYTLSEEYQYGNMQINSPSGNFMSYEDKILFLEYNSQKYAYSLYEMDKETGEIHLFCRDATCTHDSGKCASGGAFANLEQYGGKLYAMSGGWQIMELKDGKFEQIVDGAVNCFWHAGNNLYAVSKDESLMVFENGSSKPKILLDEYTGIWNVVFGNYLYGCTSEGVVRVDLQAGNPKKEFVVEGCAMIDGESIYYIDDRTSYLYRCDMDGSNSVQLTEKPVLRASLNYDEEYLYFRLWYDALDGEGSHEIYRLKKENPEEPEKIAKLQEHVYQIYTVPGYDKLIVSTQKEFVQDAQHEIYVVAKDGSSVEKLEVLEF